MKVSAKLTNLRIAPRKVRLVSNLIKNLNVADAVNQLDIHVKRSNPYFKKLLLSAASNGENDFGLDKNNLYIFDIIVDAGPTLKRWMPKAYGRAGQILKRTSQIEIILEERIEGKGRKSKEELEKEKKKRMEEKRKNEKIIAKEAEDNRKESADNVARGAAGGEKEAAKKEAQIIKTKEIKNSLAGGEKKGGLVSKIFRRKSM